MVHQLMQLPTEIWFEISSFIPIDDLVNSQLFLLSKPFLRYFLDHHDFVVDEEFADHQILQHDNNHNHRTNKYDGDGTGGLFYKILCQCLAREFIGKTIERIMARRFFMYSVGDFDEARNNHDYELYSRKGNNNNGTAYAYPTATDMDMETGPRKVHSYSRVNAEPCGQSMAKLRKKLKRLIEFSLNYFPHLYEEFKIEIDGALKKSIKACTHIDKLSNGQVISEIIKENFYLLNRKPNKPKIWDLDRREKSIEIREKKLKERNNVQWKILWKYQYREFLLDELKFYRDKLGSRLLILKAPERIYGKGSNIPIDDLLDIIEKILEIIPRLGSKIFKEYQEKNLFMYKKKAIRGEPKANINLIDSIIITLSQCVKYRQYCIPRREDVIGEEKFERVVAILDRCMKLHEEYFTTLKCIFSDTSIYHYIVKLESNELLERYLTPVAMERIREAISMHNSFLMYCVICIDEPSDTIINFLRTLYLTIDFKLNGYETNIGTEIMEGGGVYRESFDSRKWYQLLIELFGKQEILDSFNVDSLTSFSYLPETHKTVIKELFGKEFEEKYDKVMDDHNKVAAYMGQDWDDVEGQGWDQQSI
ncbi:predicted protein [Naegleria gruberi]|uniref:Predicted protein n=1 Tax=Naegleria gruberi TaxID=5762 RepID=D2V3U2_NAEGR|nr:uncharacterized protein NAEGRDRAFT_63489 [Naegleria gruberi]EFC48415.1 predicted protein [Naegleria gruberi]|eukprot:XP_002681159.1 predicted protein [Naegleria gruberi strain NEG-M]